jgi:predicted RNA binding protein YcfA (HicA-like mRNA interferase family)
MAAWRPVKRRDFIRKLRALGFEGPFSGTRHQFMVSGQHRQTIPTNPEYSVPQIRMLLRQVESIIGRPVSTDEWESL